MKRSTYLTVIVLGALAFISFHLLAAPSPCPNGTAYNESILTESCDNPNGQVRCTLAEFGYAPTPNSRGFQVVARPTVGPRWCPGATTFQSP